MSSYFESQYAPLINEVRNAVDPIVSGRPFFLASFCVFDFGNCIWESEKFEIFSLELPESLKPYLISWHRRRKLKIALYDRSLDGINVFVEFLPLLLSIPKRGGSERSVSSVVSTKFGPRIIRVPGDGSLFGRTNRISPQGAVRLRARAVTARAERSSIWRKRQRNFVYSPSYPNISESVQLPTHQVFTIGGGLIYDIADSHNVDLVQRSAVRTLTPNFRNLRKWELPINPYSMGDTRVSTRFGYQSVRGLSSSVSGFEFDWIGPTGWFVSVPAPNHIIDSEADAKAFRSLLRNIDNNLDRESNQTPTNIVQLRQVVNMIAKSAKTIRGAVRSVKRGDFSAASKALFGTSRPNLRKGGKLSATQSVARNWLELQYGWKPLLKDIKSTVDSLHREFHGSIRVARGVGITRSTTEIKFNGPFHASFLSVAPFEAGKMAINRTQRVEYGIRYTVSDQDRAILAQTGFLSPISLAWEVVPFSFVVDWFYPIGPYLESLAAFEGLTFSDGYRSTFSRELSGILLDYSGVRGTSTLWQFDIRGGLQRQSVDFHRYVLSTFPDRPRLALKNPISVIHAANAVALMISGFKLRK